MKILNQENSVSLIHITLNYYTLIWFFWYVLIKWSHPHPRCVKTLWHWWWKWNNSYWRHSIFSIKTIRVDFLFNKIYAFCYDNPKTRHINQIIFSFVHLELREIAYSDACYSVYNHGLYFLVEENFMLLVIRRFMCQQSNGYFQLVENYHAISSIV